MIIANQHSLLFFTHFPARIKNSANLETRQSVIFDWLGFVCLNADNPEQCEDYEIRMCCPTDWDCEWENYDTCDKTCGGGTKTKLSTCLDGNGQPRKSGKLKMRLFEIDN